jgi:hypothetical protein
MTSNIGPRLRQYSSAFSYVRKVQCWWASVPQGTVSCHYLYTRISGTYNGDIYIYGGTCSMATYGFIYIYIYTKIWRDVATGVVWACAAS